MVIGIISLILGIIGIFLPVLPTTPFILLSSICFSKSSERLHNYIINNRIFGKYIRDYQEKKGITLKNKIITILFLITGLTISFFKTNSPHMKIFLVIVLIGVSIHIMKLKTLK